MNVLRPTAISIKQSPELGEHLKAEEIMASWGQITDVTGIPLDSDRSPLAEGINFKKQACPFADSPSRNIEGIEVSGLEQERLDQSYGAIRRLLLATRVSYLAVTGFEHDRPLQIIDGINILSFMQFLPIYLVHRSKNAAPAQGSLPEHVVLGANAASGSIGALGAYGKGRLTLALPSGEAANAAVEDKGSLVGSKTVCVASPKKIKRFLNLLKEGRDYGFGDISTETAGMLLNDEFARALIFGTRMEELRARNTRINQITSKHQPIIQAQEQRKHNNLGVARAKTSLASAVAPLVLECLAINAQLNICLDRESN